VGLVKIPMAARMEQQQISACGISLSLRELTATRYRHDLPPLRGHHQLSTISLHRQGDPEMGQRQMRPHGTGRLQNRVQIGGIGLSGDENQTAGVLHVVLIMRGG
jgi:hypothetical protein